MLEFIGHDKVLVSLATPHFINSCINKTKKLSINMVDETILSQADYSGSVSGAKEDKSDLFDYEFGYVGMPIIRKSLRALYAKLTTPMLKENT